jgi:hypothetical protein
MSRHRYCTTSDRDGFIEELAVQLWEERQEDAENGSWMEATPQMQRKFRQLAAETLRILEHGHG